MSLAFFQCRVGKSLSHLYFSSCQCTKTLNFFCDEKKEKWNENFDHRLSFSSSGPKWTFAWKLNLFFIRSPRPFIIGFCQENYESKSTFFSLDLGTGKLFKAIILHSRLRSFYIKPNLCRMKVFALEVQNIVFMKS